MKVRSHNSLLRVFVLLWFAFVFSVWLAPVADARADGSVVSITARKKTAVMTEYDVAYMSGGLRVKGKLFVPAAAASGAKLPGVVFNHGGVNGVTWTTEARCEELAGDGYVTFAPSYRGEDGSEGEIEVAAGEVDDALNAAALLAGLPYVDPGRIGMAGTSHGALITLLAATRTDKIKAAVAAYGVTNAVSWYKYLVANGFDVSDPLSRKVYGNGPEDRPEAFRVRSPALIADKIRAPVLLLYGKNDKTVPPSQGEEMAKALKKHGKEHTIKVYPAIGHGFLFYLNASKHTAEEMKHANAAWAELKKFLASKLKNAKVRKNG